MISDPPSTESLADETSESDLQELLSDYRAAIESLPNRAERDCERAILTVLLARESLAKAITKGPQNPSDLFVETSNLDEELKAKAGVIISCVGAKSFQNWRDLVQPSESAWWWFLDKRVSDAERTRAIVWVLLTGFCVTLIISIAADISSRFLVGVPDKFSILSTASQVFLALLAGSSFTQAGREWVCRLLAAIHIRPRLQPFFGFVLALVVLSAAIGFGIVCRRWRSFTTSAELNPCETTKSAPRCETAAVQSKDTDVGNETSFRRSHRAVMKPNRRLIRFLQLTSLMLFR